MEQNTSQNEHHAGRTAESKAARERVGVLGRPVLRASPSSMQSARDSIMKAMDIIESENSDLRTLSSRITSEMEKLQVENERLRKELEIVSNEKDKTLKNMNDLLDNSRKIQKQLEGKVGELEKKLFLHTDTEKRLSEENYRFRKDLDNLRGNITEKENNLIMMAKEMECMQIKLDRAARRSFSETDIELVHELEMLKNQRREWASEKQELGKLQKKLRTDLSNLEIQLVDKETELKNETRRHGLLTKEFNSLLEENNRLKLQLRRRGNNNVLNGTENVANTQDDVITVIIPYSQQESSSSSSPAASTTTSRMQTSSVGGGHSGTSTNVSSTDKISSSRDYPLTSREARNMVTRSHTFIAPSREPSLFKQNASFSIRETQARVQNPQIGRPSAAALGGLGRMSPDALPSLSSVQQNSYGTGKGGKWRP